MQKALPQQVPTRSHLQGGFTLIELMVVIAIIGIMSTLGIASYFRFTDDQRVRGAALETQSFLRDIQNRAKMGDRGNGACATDGDPGGVLGKVFCGWEVTITNGSNQASAAPLCDNRSKDVLNANPNPVACDSRYLQKGDSKTYDLPHPVIFGGDADIVFPHLYDNLSTGANSCIITKDSTDNSLIASFTIAAGGGLSNLYINGTCSP